MRCFVNWAIGAWRHLPSVSLGQYAWLYLGMGVASVVSGPLSVAEKPRTGAWDLTRDGRDERSGETGEDNRRQRGEFGLRPPASPERAGSRWRAGIADLKSRRQESIVDFGLRNADWGYAF
jgi:hypothetical protein